MILSQLNLKKVKLEYPKSGFKSKKDKNAKLYIFLHHSSSTFFRVQLKFAFRIRHKSG